MIDIGGQQHGQDLLFDWSQLAPKKFELSHCSVDQGSSLDALLWLGVVPRAEPYEYSEKRKAKKYFCQIA